ncbi:hypothetical protein KC318_g1031 [Hortaea werneckii]|nr:hypothetical protein KC334_g499 [Hortaea werneckii]KAI7023001.1 hypothetical protein KC355_g1869 [Hortaea werneckii]KAI7202302.1 hypothetical protein KC324_g1805 [Hortaea werneckii]KAI7594256.1 hypothetical protein KC316_g1228 [Hortaea werneckii]KAI7675317.1 hypothetical protein KC318_g1031 [Hortaea werneckii]
MQNGLPAGWRVSNSGGSWQAAAAPDRDDEDAAEIGAEEGLEPEDLRPDSPGWEDVEEENEELQVKSLLDEQVFPSVRAMVEHFLDFYSTLRLINYIRSQVATGNTKPDCSSPQAWMDDKYMQPVLEDDALLYSIDDLADPNDPEDPLIEPPEPEQPTEGQKTLVQRALS